MANEKEKVIEAEKTIIKLKEEMGKFKKSSENLEEAKNITLKCVEKAEGLKKEAERMVKEVNDMVRKEEEIAQGLKKKVEEMVQQSQETIKKFSDFFFLVEHRLKKQSFILIGIISILIVCFILLLKNV